MADLKEIGWFPKTWIVTRFTDLSPDEIQEMEELAEEESEGGEEGDGGGGGGGGIGGMGDMGGEGDDFDMDVDVDTEGGAPEDADEVGDEEEPEGEEEFEVEGRKIERKVILEIRKDARRKKRYSNLIKMSKRAKRGSNPFQYLLESKELDGLTSSVPKNDDMLVEDVNGSEGLLVEWSVPEKERLEVINEIKNVLKGQPASVAAGSDTDISQDDLPT